MHVLIVEDEETLAGLIQEALGHENITSDTVGDGAQALKKIQSGNYQMIILDLNLPVLTGLEVIRTLREEGNRIPVIMVTGMRAVDDRVAGLEAGADDYITKPFSLDELLARVRALMRRREMDRAEPLKVDEKVLGPTKRKMARGATEKSGIGFVIEQRKLAAIMFTDIVGYTALMSKDEGKALQMLDRNRKVLKFIIQQFRGEWLKEIGDGTLSSFQSAVDAVNCALEVQRSLKDDPDLSLRIGIHVGDVVVKASDIFGDGVNVASRIEPLAEPGGVCISEKVYDEIKNKPDIKAVLLGERKLKNVDRLITVYSLTG